MPFDEISKNWTTVSAKSAKAKAGEKSYLSQLSLVAGAVDRVESRITQAEAQVTKLAAAYKTILTDLKVLEKAVDDAVSQGESFVPEKDPNTGEMKTNVVLKIGLYRTFLEKLAASLVKDKKKL